MLFWSALSLFILAIAREFKEERGVVIVGEKSYHAALIEFQNILCFYHNDNLEISNHFRKAFIESEKLFKNVNRTIKLAIFDMNMSMNTSSKLEITSYPTLRLFINQKQVGNFNSSQKNVSQILHWFNETLIFQSQKQNLQFKDKLLKNLSHIKEWHEKSFPSNSLVYCGSNSTEFDIKAIEKLNYTFHAVPSIQPLVSKCNDSMFMYVRRKSLLEEESTTISAALHLSHIIKAIRNLVNQKTLFYGSPVQPFLAIVVDSLLYAFASNKSDPVTLMRKKRLMEFENELQKVEYQNVGLLDIKNNWIKSNNLSNVVPPYIILSKSIGDIRIKQFQKQISHQDILEFVVKKNDSVFLAQPPTLVPLTDYLNNLQQEDGIFAFIKTKQQIFEKCNDCLKINIILQPLISELYIHNGFQMQVRFVSIQDAKNIGEQGISELPYIVVKDNGTIIYEREKPQRMKLDDLVYIAQELDRVHQLDSINRESLERVSNLEFQKKFDKTMISSQQIRQTYKEARIIKQNEDL